MEFTLSDLSEKLNLKLNGDPSHVITRISPPEDADTSSLCIIWDKGIISALDITVPIAAPSEFFTQGRDGLICEKPRAMLPEILALFTSDTEISGLKAKISEKAEISESAKISPDSYIAPFAYIGENCEVSEGTIIEPQAVLLKNVKVGKNCIIHSGAVIGCDGFGFERTSEGLVKIPQNGGVIIGDDVEIGACSTIDRGTMSDTVIGSGTKIDNHVQIGHNVKIGRNCIICSMSGIAGSSTLGDDVTMSVQAGITDHVHIGSRVIIAGRSGVTSDIPDNSIVSGFPARNHNDAKRALILAADLPSLVKRIRVLEKKLESKLQS